jgi:hypothetical protein
VRNILLSILWKCGLDFALQFWFRVPENDINVFLDDILLPFPLLGMQFLLCFKPRPMWLGPFSSYIICKASSTRSQILTNMNTGCGVTIRNTIDVCLSYQDVVAINFLWEWRVAAHPSGLQGYHQLQHAESLIPNNPLQKELIFGEM